MTETNEPVATENAADSPPTAEPAKSPLMRQLALIALLAVMLGALYYDRQIARPNSKAKSEELMAAGNQRLGGSSAQLTPDDVAELMGKSPSSDEDSEEYFEETYRWMAGLPWRSYYVVVLYSKSNGQPQYYTSTYNEEPPASMYPGYEPPPEDLSDPPTPADIGGAPVEEVGEPPSNAAMDNGDSNSAGSPKR